uniref:hypothetical protein n=1 Tax=Nocardia altamirensis TaxID=472158 RepID=UPI0008408B29
MMIDEPGKESLSVLADDLEAHDQARYKSERAEYAADLELYDRQHMTVIAAKLRAAGPPLPPLVRTPIIADIPVGEDPAHLLALLCLAASRYLALVITPDVTSTRYARDVLDAVGHGRTDVVAASTGQHRTTALLDPVRALCDAAPAWLPLRWIATGSPTHLAELGRCAPDLSTRLAVTQPDSHFGEAPVDAEHVLATTEHLWLVLSDTVGNRTVTANEFLSGSERSVTAVINSHPHRDHPSPAMPLVATAAGLELPAVLFTRRRATLDDSGRVLVETITDPALTNQRWVSGTIDDTLHACLQIQ